MTANVAAINTNTVEPLAGPNTGTGTEFGDSWNTAATKLNSMTGAQLVTNAGSGATTAAAGDITGSGICNLILTAVGAANYTTRTGAQMFADIPGAYVGMTWMIFIRNTNAGTTTVAAGATGVTINGTATIAQNVTRIFQAQITAANTIVMQSMGILAAGA